MHNILVDSSKSITRNKNFSFSPSIFSGLVAFIDLLAILLPGSLICIAYLNVEGHEFSFYASVVIVNSILIIILFNVGGLYDFDRIVQPIHQIDKIFFICGMVFLGFLLFVFSIKVSSYFSRLWFFSWFCSTVLLIYTGRIICYHIIYHWSCKGKITRNIVIVGGGEQAKKLLHHLRQKKEPWNRIVGIFDDRLQRTPAIVANYSFLGAVNDLLTLARQQRIDDIVIALPWSAEERIRNIIDKIKELPVCIRLSSDLAGLNYIERNISRLGNALMLDITNKPINGWAIIVKALEDKIFSILILLFIAPVMLLIAIAIKIDSKGPVFFRQARHGFNNQTFIVYKFRTMYYDKIQEKAFAQTTQHDSRITRVGRFLRRTSLDEFPQLFNVLQGTMSLVGPRPHPIPLDDQFACLIDGYFARHRVKPGMTGWAQVSGYRGETDISEKMRARFEHDIYYIENWSLLFDIKILIMTFFVGFVHKNAY